jgi:hypothetical protein
MVCKKFFHPPAISVPSEDLINLLMSDDVVSSPVRNDSSKKLHPIEEAGVELFE